MSPRISPSFVVAVLALVLAAGGTGYAAGKITSAQIKDGTVQSRDVRDATLAGRDVKNGSLGRAELDRSCATGESAVFGGCVRRTATGPSSYMAAVDDCNRRGGRLPSIGELKWIAANAEFGWADGNVSNYEFTGAFTTTNPYTPLGFDRGGNGIDNSSAQVFWHHCVTS